MVIVIANGSIAPERRQAYLDAVKECGAVPATQAETGCISYDVLATAASADGLYIVERWDGFPALQAHMKAPNIAKLNALNSEFGVSYEAKVYNANPLG